MAAENNILAALKIIPPINALMMLDESACCKSFIKLLPWLPMLPKVNADKMENNKIPIT